MQDKKQRPATLQLLVGGYSCAGIKAENQDAFAAKVPSNYELESKGAVAVIADGVSSASRAADAAQMAVTQFIEEFYATPETWSTKKSAGQVLNSLNQWLYGQSSVLECASDLAASEHHADKHHNTEQALALSQEQYQQWLTTFSAIIFKSTTGFIFHVGDSRISVFQQHKIIPLTKDHNQKQGRHNIVLTRALGADSRLKVDVHQIDLQSQDIYLLTCDGVHDFVKNKTLIDILKTLPETPSNTDLATASKHIVEQALAAGSDDNVSCLLVCVKQLPTKQLDEIERELLAKAIPPALKVGQKIDDYQVGKILHASTRSHLYLVQKNNEEPLVLKTPSANFSEDSLYLQGFIREAWVGERINHAHVMKIKTPPQNSQFLYHLCEYIDGQTLTDWMRDNPQPSIAQVRDIIEQLVAALRVFQRLEIVHRDIHPDNIMIDSNGQIKLIDYGSAWVAALAERQDTLAETMPQGSVNYCAPETLISLKANHQSDLFSVGVICYQLLCQELPFKPLSYATIQKLTTQADLSPWQYRSIKQFRPELPIWLDLLLKQATEPQPANRYQAYSELLNDLSTPNIAAVEAYKQQPLLQRDPIKFWQTTSLILAIALIAALLH